MVSHTSRTTIFRRVAKRRVRSHTQRLFGKVSVFFGKHVRLDHLARAPHSTFVHITELDSPFLFRLLGD